MPTKPYSQSEAAPVAVDYVAPPPPRIPGPPALPSKLWAEVAADEVVGMLLARRAHKLATRGVSEGA